MPDEVRHDLREHESLPPGYPTWWRLHLLASWTVTIIAVAHCVVTALVFSAWSERAVWFLGTGLGALLVGTLNLAHIGLAPCRLPTSRFVVAANWGYLVFGVATLVAVPQPQAIVLVAALSTQAIASRVTLPGPG